MSSKLREPIPWPSLALAAVLSGCVLAAAGPDGGAAGAAGPVLPARPVAESATAPVPWATVRRGPTAPGGTEYSSWMQVSGCPRIEYTHTLPKISAGGGGPDERAARSKGPNMVNWEPGWGESFFRFGMLDGTWQPPGGGNPVRLFHPSSICRAATAFQGDGWAAAEMVFDTPNDSGMQPRAAIRIMRLADDPWLYMRLTFSAEKGVFPAAWLSALPLQHEWGDRRPHLDIQRAVWIAGHDFQLEKNSKDAVDVADDAKPGFEGGVFWYNRKSYRTGGNLTVFLPEQVARVGARWGFPVSVSFSPRQPSTGVVLHLALYVWRDDAGWERGLERFRDELPARVAKLRSLAFAWPVGEQLDPWESETVARLLETANLLAAADHAVLSAELAGYRQALAAVADEPLAETAERARRESELFVRRERLRSLVDRHLAEAMEKGWPLVDGSEAAVNEIEGLLNDF